MSSVRVPDDLLDRLHQATPRGTSLAKVIEAALSAAGGPDAVRADLERKDRRERARAQVARLRRMGHRSVCLDPGEQVGLAEAARRRRIRFETLGRWRYDPGERSITLRAPSRRRDDGPIVERGPREG